MFVFPFFQHFSGVFKGESYDSDLPPRKAFLNNVSCKLFVKFIQETLLDRLETGAVSLLGKVGEVQPPHLVLPLTVEPTKPRLCHDARFLNLWMQDKPFKLDHVGDLPRYVSRNSYQSVLDDNSGYDHILLTNDSRTFFGIQWGGWYFTYNTLPFGWKISPYVYHNTGLVATNFFRSLNVPCLLYIDDRHNRQLQISLDKGVYADIPTPDERRFAAAKSALFLVAYFLIQLGYFLGLAKSVSSPRMVVPYLGFLSDSARQVFHLIHDKKNKFFKLIREVLDAKAVTIKTLQRLVGPKLIWVCGALREEISHWLFLETWDDPLPWRDERHVRVLVAVDVSNFAWGGSLISPMSADTSDYWTNEEQSWDIATEEATALERVLLAFQNQLRNSRVDALVDNQAVVQALNNQGGKSGPLNKALKRLFFTMVDQNASLHLSYISTNDNPADSHSCRLSTMDSKLCPALWKVVEQEFGGPTGHKCD